MSFLDRFKKKPLDREVEDAVEEGSSRVEPRLGEESAPWVRVDPETGEIHPDDTPQGLSAQRAQAASSVAENGFVATASATASTAAGTSESPAAPPPFDPYGIGASPFEVVPPAEPQASPETPAATSASPAAASSAPFVPVEVRPEPAFEPAHAAPKSVREEEPELRPEAVMKPVPRERARAAAAERAARPVRGFSVGAAAPSGPSEEELIARRRTKNRLVGAAVLMAALVVAAPFVMDDPRPRDEAPLSTEVPSMPPAATDVTTELPLNAPPTPKAEGDTMVRHSDLGKAGESVAKANLAQEARDSVAKAEAEKKAAEAAKSAQNAQTPKTTAKTNEKAATKKPDAKADAKTDKPAAKPALKPTKTVGITPPTGEGWYVQVMATSSERQAEAAVKTIVDLGLPAYRIPVEKGAATLWRVRVGLYKTKKDAEGVVGNLVLNGVGSKPYVAKQ